MQNKNKTWDIRLRAIKAYLNARIDQLEAVLLEKMQPHRPLDQQTADSGFLPNFCNGWTIFNVAVIAEMLAIVVALVAPQIPIAETRVGNLFMVSLFIQWIAMASAAALCITRTYLNRLSNLRALLLAYLMLLCITWLVGESSLWVLWLGGFIGSPRPEWNAYFHVQNLTIAAIINALALRYFLARHQLLRSSAAEARAKIQVLRSRIRPHFIFNTLNIIASLIRSAPAQAETAIENMADLFRTMLGDDENLVPIKNEIAVATKYLEIENLRLDNRLQVLWDVGKFPRRAAMPILTLQPLLEYAIQHGIEPLTEGGRVSVRLWEENDAIRIHIASPLPRSKSRHAYAGVLESGKDVALDNLRLRLESHYGQTAKLETLEESGRFNINVSLPTRGDNL